MAKVKTQDDINRVLVSSYTALSQLMRDGQVATSHVTKTILAKNVYLGADLKRMRKELGMSKKDLSLVIGTPVKLIKYIEAGFTSFYDLQLSASSEPTPLVRSLKTFFEERLAAIAEKASQEKAAAEREDAASTPRLKGAPSKKAHWPYKALAEQRESHQKQQK